jgi:hypothetical protein
MITLNINGDRTLEERLEQEKRERQGLNFAWTMIGLCFLALSVNAYYMAEDPCVRLKHKEEYAYCMSESKRTVSNGLFIGYFSGFGIAGYLNWRAREKRRSGNGN